MPEIHRFVVLANSRKKGGRCIAGKLLTLRPDDLYDVGEWIRPIDASTDEGEIPNATARIKGHALQPFDIVEVSLDGNANDPNHPEDWIITKGVPWSQKGTIDRGSLPNLFDHPTNLWANNWIHSRKVPIGFVPSMETPATLTLIQPETASRIEVFQQTFERTTTKCRLHLAYGGLNHEFDVTDDAFLAKHQIFQSANKENSFNIDFLDPAKVAFCLSLTPPFSRNNDPKYHYKIAATIFEIP
jgi:hypothetical protein